MTLTGWEIALLVAAAYVAIFSLVRIMRNRRNEITSEFHEQVLAEKKRLAGIKKKAKK